MLKKLGCLEGQETRRHGVAFWRRPAGVLGLGVGKKQQQGKPAAFE